MDDPKKLLGPLLVFIAILGGTYFLLEEYGPERPDADPAATAAAEAAGDATEEAADADGPAPAALSADALASRVAGFPSDAVRLAKRSLLNAAGDLTPGLLAESDLFAQTLHTQDARDRMRRFLDEGGQTREVELRVAEVTTDWT